MGKSADKYFITDSWKILEDGFAPEYGMVAESVFSLGNEYMGARGYFDEGYGGETLCGSYFNGIYESRGQDGPSYKGMVGETEFMVNAVDWLYTRIFAGEEQLDLHTCKTEEFRRSLDMRTGLLVRSFLWRTASGQSIRVSMERLISMSRIENAAQRIVLTSLDYEGEITVYSGLDFTTVHGGEKRNYWQCTGKNAGESGLFISGRTQTTQKEVGSFSSLTVRAALEPAVEYIEEEKKVYAAYRFRLAQGETWELEKDIHNKTHLSEAGEQMYMPLSDMLTDNGKWWQEVWERSDIEIEGDEENQQGIRFCIFQMFQTYHGAVKGTNIGAKGLTGESYNGNAFWDTETYCLPFFLFHDKQAAYNLLYFRYATLDAARKRAGELDCRGAFYPIATISGRECCNLWQHANLQLQPSTSVAYAIWMYEKVTGDDGFLKQYGLEMLVEICRMLADRGDYNAKHTKYGYFGVMGPDEFQMMVNHNCYTNYMGRFTLLYTLDAFERLEKSDSTCTAAVYAVTGCTETERKIWRKLAEDMYIPQDEDSKIYEQHEGYFDLPHLDIDSIPVEEFPLYHHWSYDRIYRNDMIKQPDVLMMMLLFNSSFTEEEIEKNYEYYEPRCIHESSLSPSVHSILAAQLGKGEEAYQFFRFATRMDLDNYNRNSSEGLHTTSIAAAWMNIVYGFGGLRSDGEVLSLSPSIPPCWKSYRFRIVYGDDIISVAVDRETIRIKTLQGTSIGIRVLGKDLTVSGEEQKVSMGG